MIYMQRILGSAVLLLALNYCMPVRANPCSGGVDVGIVDHGYALGDGVGIAQDNDVIVPEKSDEGKMEEKTSQEVYEEKKGTATETIEKKEGKKPVVLKTNVYFWDRSSYVGITLGYGGYFPLGDYATRYKPAHQFAAAVPVYYLTFWHICPELHVRYASMDSKPDLLRYDSTMSLLQVFPALLFRWDFNVPEKYRGPVQVYARIYDGVTRVGFTSVNQFFPFLGKSTVVEFINIFGFSAGCNYFLYKGLFVGLDVGYSIIATAGKPLQSMSLMAQVGYRFL